jgi:hypothetical protein
MNRPPYPHHLYHLCRDTDEKSFEKLVEVAHQEELIPAECTFEGVAPLPRFQALYRLLIGPGSSPKKVRR